MNRSNNTLGIIVCQSDAIRIEFSILDKNFRIISLGTEFCIDKVSCSINVLYNNKIVQCIPDKNGDFQLFHSEFQDRIGSGSKLSLILEFTDESEELKINLTARLDIKVYYEHGFCTLKLILIDADKQLSFLPLHSLSPFNVINGELKLNKKGLTKPENVSFFENGFQSWSFTKTRFYNEKYTPIEVDIIARIHQNMDNCVTGWYISESVTAISDIDSKGTIVLGFCTLADAYSRIVMDKFSSPSQISWLSAYSQFDKIPIDKIKKKPISSEELFVSFYSDGEGYRGLQEYAKLTGKKMDVQIQSLKTGWCSWYYYYTEITNKELLDNVNFFKENPTIAIDTIQLDDGYFTAVGDYTSFNKKFPSGVQEFVNQVHFQRKLAGIWLAPFFAAENSEIYQKHPEWFLKSKLDNELIPVHYNWQQIEYALDITNKEVQKHIKNLIHVVTNVWNIDFIKIDFLYASSVYLSNYSEEGYTRAQVYRQGIEIIKEVLGSRGYILGCGAPIGPSIGIFDAMRVSGDTKEIWETEYEPLYSVPCLKYALINTIYRSFMNNSLWINDPDCLIVRKERSKLTEEEVRLQLTILGLAGGQILLSDDMKELDDDRLHLALKLIPPYFKSAIPIDALFSSLPTLYSLETDCVLGRRILVAIINWEDEIESKLLVLNQILSKNFQFSKVLLFDWWNEELIGIITSEESFKIEIPAHGCRYLGVIPWDETEKIKSPLVLASTIHITQGCKEITEISCNSNELFLNIKLDGFHKGRIFILFPFDFELKSIDVPFKVKKTSWGDLYSFSVSFVNDLQWKINFTKIL